MAVPEPGVPFDGAATPNQPSGGGPLGPEAEVHRLLLAGIGHAVIAVDAAGRIFYWNRAAEELYGYRADEVLGRDVMEVTAPEISRNEAEAILREVARGEPWTGEFRVRRKDGTAFSAMVTDRPILDERGELVAIVGVNVDVTDRVETEIALRESEARYRSVVELMPETVLVYGEERILYANRAAADLAGLETPEDLIGRNVLDLLHPEERDRLSDRMIEAQAGGAIRRGFLERARTPSGEERILEVSSAPINFGGKPARQAVVRDVTERVRMQEELQRLASHLDTAREEEQSRLSREIHDELGQILTGLKLDVAWLERRLQADPEAYPDRDELSDRVQEIRRQVDEAMISVRDVTRDLRPTVLDDLGLQAGLEWLVQQFEGRFEGSCDVRIEFSSSDLPVAPASATALFRILQEALTNVLRHSEASQARIRAEELEDGVVLIVQDDGVGFDRDAAGGTASSGLLVMRERARSCGGALGIRSRPGEGTVVSARIPLLEDDREDAL